MLRFAAILAGTAALFAAASGAHAASFNCAGRLTLTEATICAVTPLSAKDSYMSDQYHQLLGFLSGAEKRGVQQSQVRWLARRNACGGNVGCLNRAYDRRIAYIDSYFN
jgi:uncharacterized protein